jgi:hypothetical protein
VWAQDLPGNANPPIGGFKGAIQENGDPRDGNKRKTGQIQELKAEEEEGSFAALKDDGEKRTAKGNAAQAGVLVPPTAKNESRREVPRRGARSG